ncbi:MAG: acyl-CoA thioesterase [Congregibacter sp.]
MSNTYKETLRIRFRDTDAQGHMFFANYLVLADEVAGYYMKDLGFDWSDPDKMPCFVFTANANCDYLHECLAGDEVCVEVGYDRIGNTSATMSFSMTRTRDDVALAKGGFTHVFVDPQTRKPQPVPESVREALTVID